MDADYKDNPASSLRSYKTRLDEDPSKNPYGLPITMVTWGGPGAAVGFAVQMCFFHLAFPDIIETDYTLILAANAAAAVAK
jgi:endoglucanase